MMCRFVSQLLHTIKAISRVEILTNALCPLPDSVPKLVTLMASQGILPPTES